jgi:hypothetical protein
VLFEELTKAQAEEVLRKQSTNAQAPRNAGRAQLTNEKGEPMSSEVHMEESFENQGEVVATISDGPAGRFTGGEGGTITRAQSDQVARQNTQESADALRDGLNVSVEPTKRG